MPPKRGELGKVAINKLLADVGLEFTDEELALTNKNWLVDLAAGAGIVTPQQRAASMDKQIIVRKRHLRTLVQDPVLLRKLDIYVQLASRVRAVGSKVLNLFAITSFEEGAFSGAGADAFIERTLLDQTFVKYGMLPFKGVISGSSSVEGVPADLRSTWVRFAPLLRPMYPSDEELRSTFPWDQPLTDMAREYIGALSAHVMTHLGQRLNAHVKRVLTDDLRVRVRHDATLGRMMGVLPPPPQDAPTTSAAATAAHPPFFMSDMYAALDRNAPPDLALPPAVVALVGGLRLQLGLTGNARISKLTKLTAAAVRLHFQLSRGRTDKDNNPVPTFSACPVVKTHRAFAYLDERMMATLLPSSAPPSTNAMATLLHLTSEAWSAANKAGRRAHRNAKKGRPQKKRCGFGSAGWKAADGWTATSATMDGVSLCVTLTRERCATRQFKEPEEATGDAACTCRIASFAAAEGVGVGDLHLVSDDPGLVNLFQAVQKQADGSVVSSRLTRESYRRRDLEKRRLEEECARRAARPSLVAAVALLSGSTWRTTDLAAFVRMVELHASVDAELVREYVEDDWYARWKMRLWRRRRSVLMQSYVGVLKAAPTGVPIVYGRGAAGFASSGRGAASVPTVGSYRCLHLASRSLCTERHVLLCKVGEARTSMCCHRCGSVMRNLLDDDGRAIRGLKLCSACPALPEQLALPHWVRVVHVGDAALELPMALAAACDTCSHPGGGAHHEVAYGELDDIKDDKGRVLRRLKLCTHTWDEMHASKLRNRDLNAAMNIWAALHALVNDLPRPLHLCKQRRVRRAAATMAAAPPGAA